MERIALLHGLEPRTKVTGELLLRVLLQPFLHHARLFRASFE